MLLLAHDISEQREIKKGALTSMTDIHNDKNNMTKKNRFPLTAIVAVAAAFALVIGGFAMTRYRTDPEKELTSQAVTQTGTASDKSYIGRDAALTATLTHAGVAAADAKRIRIEFDNNDGRMVYEIEWKSGRTEYDYEVDAITGQILKAEKNIDD